MIEVKRNERNAVFLQTANVCIAKIVIKYTKIPALNSEKQEDAKGKIVI